MRQTQLVHILYAQREKPRGQSRGFISFTIFGNKTLAGEKTRVNWTANSGRPSPCFSLFFLKGGMLCIYVCELLNNAGTTTNYSSMQPASRGQNARNNPLHYSLSATTTMMMKSLARSLSLQSPLFFLYIFIIIAAFGLFM